MSTKQRFLSLNINIDHQDYKQPPFYRFSEDSLHLVRTVFDLEKNKTIERLLDLCAGCGVVGLEFFLRKNSIKEVEFCELQSDFINYLKENIHTFGRSHFVVHHLNFEYLNKDKQYDLILCNPPYFYQQHGLLPNDPRKQKCHFFLEGSFETLFDITNDLLVSDGRAYFVFRDDQIYMKNLILKLKSKYNLEEVKKFSSCIITRLTK